MKQVNLHFNPASLPELSTKTRLAPYLGASLRSVQSYHAIALSCLPEYREDFPSACGHSITRHPLTRFQCWILFKIQLSLKLLSKEELAYLLAENFQFAEQFTKETYESLYPASADDHAPQSLLQIPQDYAS